MAVHAARAPLGAEGGYLLSTLGVGGCGPGHLWPRALLAVPARVVVIRGGQQPRPEAVPPEALDEGRAEVRPAHGHRGVESRVEAADLEGFGSGFGFRFGFGFGFGIGLV